MPTRVKNSNVYSEQSAELVNELISKLEIFYKDYDTNSNSKFRLFQNAH